MQINLIRGFLLLFVFLISMHSVASSQSTKAVSELITVSKTFKNKKSYTIAYDKFKDRTTVLAYGFEVANKLDMFNPRFIRVSGGFDFEGDKLSQNISTFF